MERLYVMLYSPLLLKSTALAINVRRFLKEGKAELEEPPCEFYCNMTTLSAEAPVGDGIFTDPQFLPRQKSL